MLNFLKMSSVAVVAALLMTGVSRAEDVQSKYDAMSKIYKEQRSDLSMNQKVIDELAAIEGQAPADSDLKFDIVILSTRALYWKGIHETNKDARLKVFTDAMNKAVLATAVNSDYADSYYFFGISLARWAETKGVLESLSQKAKLMENLDATIARETRQGDSGEAIDGYGPHRVYGRLYFKLPGFAGGSNEKSLTHLRLANEKARTTALNTVYLADTLNATGSAQKGEACKLLADLLNQDPEKLNLDRIPETKEEFAEARKLQGDICKK